MAIWTTIGTFVGGIGLFLIGMHQMTEGLKVMAGAALRTGLARSTKTRVRALLAGAGMTAIVQSSSAVTVATIGFVNAGLVDLGGALWLIFGSNVGTTVTGWLVAATGLDVNLEVVALPAVGIGTLLSLTGGDGRRGAAGRAIAGFGLFFLGLAIMSQAFRGVADGFDPASIAVSGFLGVLVFVVVGVVLTTLTQSSSAAIAITLTAATTGVLPLSSAAAMVIGANLGTTSTAAFSVIGATPPAKRAAAGQVVFNLLAAVVALVLAPFLLAGIELAIETTGEEPSPAVSLAAFHTVFNLLGVVLVWPLAGRLQRALTARFGNAEEVAQQPKYLDRNVLEVPEVALTAVEREVRRALVMSAEVLAEALEDEAPPPARVERRGAVVDQLEQAIGEFTGDLAARRLTPEAAAALRGLLRAVAHARIVREQAVQVAVLRQNTALQVSPTVAAIRASTRELLAAVEAGPDLTVEEAWETLEPRFDKARAEYLDSAAAGARAAEQAFFRERLLGEIRRGVKHVLRALHDMPKTHAQG
ncbi:MAG: Na/Pi symporter [Deltaproteobacteria bacterium]|nr:Na/Pi symporter [Deltaproteobacteria bacterium]